jgi:hypothetical protein
MVWLGEAEEKVKMIELVFELLNKIGFNHTLHPAITHIPMGMVMGGFMFSLVSLRQPGLIRTARHCAVLALVFIVPTMVVGIMDWQHFYMGEWSNLIIIKFVLAGLLTALLAVTVKLGDVEKPSPLVIGLYALCLANAVGLGFTGGEIQFG